MAQQDTYNQTRYEILVTIYSQFDSLGNPVLTSGVTHTLDTYDYDMITFDMSVNEIQDISNRNASYSKPIELPDTDHNRKVFGFISNLDVDTGLFNPNKRTKCTIMVDTIPVLVGTLQLSNVITNYKSGEVKLECVFYSSVIDFYKSMGELYLTDLVGATGPTSSQYPNGTPGGLNRYNHNWTLQNVIYSWTQSQSFGYYYPLIDYGRYFTQSSTEIANGFTINNIFGAGSSYNNSVVLSQIYPAVYVKTIVDEIFAEAGFQYNSNFFNTNFFKNLIVPFSNKYMRAKSISLQDKQFAGNLQCQSQTGIVIVAKDFGPTLNYANVCAYVLNEINPGPSASFVVSSYFGDTANAIAVPFTASITNTEYYQNNTSNSIYIRPIIRWYFGPNVTEVIPWPSYFFSISFAYPTTGSAGYLCWATKKLTDTYANVKSKTYITTADFISDEGFITLTNASTNVDAFGYYELEPGEVSFVYVQIDSYLPTSGDYPVPSVGEYLGGDFDVPNQPGTQPVQYDLNYHTSSDNLPPGGPVSIPLNLPQNVKQKDFMTNLYKLFNLYVEPDKNNPRLLNIEPRDYYYLNDKFSTGKGVVIKDWTSKIDLDKDITMEILSNTQAKTTVYTYKLDNDYWNTQYNSYTNRTPGDIILEIDNDFISDTNTIETIFSSSLLVNIPGMTNFPVCNFSNQIDATLGYPVGSSNVSIKILQINRSGNYKQNGLVDLPNPYFYDPIYGFIPGDGWQFSTQSGTPPAFTFSSYPYAGPYDDPYNPTNDLSFTQQLINFYNVDTSSLTNNLYNLYHKNQFLEINDLSSRLLTCEMYLTPQDIYEFYFNHIIYLEVGGQGRYWRVNSINNFDISGRSTCTVQLISILNNGTEVPDQLGNTQSATLPPTIYTTSTTTTTTTVPGGTFILSPYYNLDITGVTGTSLPGFALPVVSGYVTSTPFSNTLPGSNTIRVTLANTSGTTYGGPQRYVSLVGNGVELYRVTATAGTSILGLTNSFNGSIIINVVT